MQIRRTIRDHRKGMAVGLVLGLLTMAAVAVAVWMVQSTGNGYARTGALQAPTLEVVTGPDYDPSGDLYPGAQGDLYLKINNPNGPLVLGQVSPSSWVSSNPGACPAANLTPESFNAGSVAVPSGVSSHVFHNRVALDINAPSACQSTIWTITLDATFSTP